MKKVGLVAALYVGWLMLSNRARLNSMHADLEALIKVTQDHQAILELMNHYGSAVNLNYLNQSAKAMLR